MTKNKRTSMKLEGSSKNDYSRFSASIKINDLEGKTIINSLYPFTKPIDLQSDIYSKQINPAYVLNGQDDVYLGFSLIQEEYRNAAIYCENDTINWLLENTPNPIKKYVQSNIRKLSNLNHDKESKSNNLIRLEKHSLEILGLENFNNTISMIWVNSLNAIVVGINLLNKQRSSFVEQ